MFGNGKKYLVSYYRAVCDYMITEQYVVSFWHSFSLQCSVVEKTSTYKYSELPLP